MAYYSTNQFKNGLKVILDGTPYSIIDNTIVKPGKGQAFNRVKLKDLINDKVLEKTFKSGESIEQADVQEYTMQYLYNDNNQWYFMDEKTFEQFGVDKTVLGENRYFLIEQDICNITLWNQKIISVTPPNHVILKITDTEPELKGNTASGGTKKAITDTGATMRVPLFINVGDNIKVDTRTKEYVSRI